MIEAVATFFTRNVRRYTYGLVATTHPYLSGLLSFFLWFDTFDLQRTLKPFSLASMFATYNTVIFGFTAAALALAIAIPNSSFLLFLSEKDAKRSTAYRDFLFILAWNGFIHILAFIFLLPIIVFGEQYLFDSSATSKVRWYLFFTFWIQFYAATQFVVTTLALYEISDLYAQFLSKQRGAQNK